MRLFRLFRDDRERVSRSVAYADTLMHEPDPEDVAWLSRVATRGDSDHALWELRYLQRALGILVAQRDSLDDRTHSAVLRALMQRMEFDANVHVDLRELAERQFNARLGAYRDAFTSRGRGSAAMRVAQNLLAFAGGPIRANDPIVQYGEQLVAGYLVSANEVLRGAFGTVHMPEDVKPSAIAT